MLSHKLVHLIQYHSENLSTSLLRRTQMSARAASYRDGSAVELKERVREIYQHLGAWLLDKDETDIDRRYIDIGARRVEQKVPLSELVWAIVLTKQNLLEFINDVSVPGRIVETSEKQELLQRIDLFFDEAVHAAVVGYEAAALKRTDAEQTATKTKSARKANKPAA
jgi:hypothetical protein